MMRIAYCFRHPLWLDYLMCNVDGHFQTFSYLARYYDLHLYTPANFVGDFQRDHYSVHGRQDIGAIIQELSAETWDAVVCYGALGEPEWPLVKAAARDAVVCSDYGGGPLTDLDGNAHPAARLFDHVFTAHETQARFLRSQGVPATKARGVPTNIYRPIPGTPKLWHVISPATFVPGKRQPLVAQYCEQFAPAKPSLFIGSFEHAMSVEMTRMGGIPLNKPEVAHRNNIQLGHRAPYAVMPLLYNAAEVCIVGSQEEAGPWTALEAMACGTPVIVMADCAWFVADAFKEMELLGHGCLVVPPEPAAIHNAVEFLLTYPDASADARAGIVRWYDWWGMYSAIDSTLKRLVGLKQAGQTLPIGGDAGGSEEEAKVLTADAGG